MSSFGWLDVDAQRRQQMLEFVDLFRDSSTVDELGIGAIRDGFSDLLFPGTSTLHTRLRYVLFLPWLMQKAGSRNQSPERQAESFKDSEYRLIQALLDGGEKRGVIGERAKRNLKRLPSEVYHSALQTWGIFEAPSPEAYFRRKAAIQQLDHGEEDSRDYVASPALGIDPNLPPTPPELDGGVRLGPTTFDLTHEEATYLADKISGTTSGSLLAYLINNPMVLHGYPWEEPIYSQLPEKFQRQLEHAYRFAAFHLLAAVLYNLMLAEKSEREDREQLIDEYGRDLEELQEMVAQEGLTQSWDRADFWRTVAITRPHLPSHTHAFADQWYWAAKQAIDTGQSIADSNGARDLVEMRERQMKGNRARLLGGPALDTWPTDSGINFLEYRWSQARSHLSDIYRGLA